MVYKFLDTTKESHAAIEFIKSNNKVIIYVYENEINPIEGQQVQLEISKENLFDLIGALLRIQSEIKKNS